MPRHYFGSKLIGLLQSAPREKNAVEYEILALDPAKLSKPATNGVIGRIR